EAPTPLDVREAPGARDRNRTRKGPTLGPGRVRYGQASGRRLLRTLRTRATAPAIPAQARIVLGSGTGDGEMTVPAAEYTEVRPPICGVLLATLTKSCENGWLVSTTKVALSLPEPSGGTLVDVLTKLARRVPLRVELPGLIGSACHEIESGE